MSRKRPWFWLLVVFLVVVVAFGTAMWALNRLLVGSAPRLGARNIVELRLAGEIVERAGTFWGSQPIGPLGLREIDRALRRAATDDRVDAVVLKVGPLATGFGKAEEIRDAIYAVRSAGKPVTAYLEIGSILDLYIASAAAHVVLVPTGNLVIGLLSRSLYYRELLDRVGVEFEVFHTGPYKTAMNPYTATGMSPEERAVIDSLLDSLWQQILSDIAADRNMTSAEVEAVLDLGWVTAEQALESGLVDDLGFDDRSLPGTANRVGLREYWRAAGSSAGWLAPTVALVHVDGMIVPGDIGEDLFGSRLAGGDTIARHLRAARNDDAVRAIVLRVDSPGGAVTASDVILREAELAAESKPLIVSMSDVAASGGYWIATAASRILADRATYTGSIGVVASRINLRGTYEKLGVGVATVKRGANADLFLEAEPLREEQRAILQASIQEHYQVFLEKVAVARAMEVAQVERLAAGRVWSGAQALDVGLVDEIGGLRAALDLAAREGGVVDSYSVRVYPEARSVFEQISSILTLARVAARPPTVSLPLDGAPFTEARLREQFDLLRRLTQAGTSWSLIQGPTPVPAR